MNGLLPIIRRARRPLVPPVDATPAVAPVVVEPQSAVPVVEPVQPAPVVAEVVTSAPAEAPERARKKGKNGRQVSTPSA